MKKKGYLTEILNPFIKDVIINKNIFSNLSKYLDEFKGIFNMMKENELKSLLDKISNLIQPVSLQLNQTSDPEGIKEEEITIPSK